MGIETESASKGTVYIVEDDLDLQAVFEASLMHEGYLVETFATADAAHAALSDAVARRREVNVILLDVLLENSKMSSLEFLGFADEASPSTQALIMSAHLPASQFLEYLVSGAAGYLSKPFSLDDLFQNVAKHTGVSKRRYQYARCPWGLTERTSRDVFFSHAASDRKWARALVKLLENTGISVWYSSRDITPADEWRTTLQTALSSCPVFIVLVSPASLGAEHVKTEIACAIQQKGKSPAEHLVVPLLYNMAIEDAPEEVQRLQCLDVTDPAKLADRIQVLRLMIERFLRRRSASAA
ncbi:TIR domain-containing protein [Candidatus Sumerlaeota bacterium]|nr:TIR domain-containing protein [Candidatus Sumerlaeota bacterium]